MLLQGNSLWAPRVAPTYNTSSHADNDEQQQQEWPRRRRRRRSRLLVHPGGPALDRLHLSMVHEEERNDDGWAAPRCWMSGGRWASAGVGPVRQLAPLNQYEGDDAGSGPGPGSFPFLVEPPTCFARGTAEATLFQLRRFEDERVELETVEVGAESVPFYVFPVQHLQVRLSGRESIDPPQIKPSQPPKPFHSFNHRITYVLPPPTPTHVQTVPPPPPRHRHPTRQRPPCRLPDRGPSRLRMVERARGCPRQPGAARGTDKGRRRSSGHRRMASRPPGPFGVGRAPPLPLAEQRRRALPAGLTAARCDGLPHRPAALAGGPAPPSGDRSGARGRRRGHVAWGCRRPALDRGRDRGGADRAAPAGREPAVCGRGPRPPRAGPEVSVRWWHLAAVAAAHAF